MNELLILTNSPGEVSGWVKPTAAELSRIKIPAEVTLAVLPCPYASGMEKEYGGGIDGIGSAVTFKEAWNGTRNAERGKRLVLQMGGDPFFGAALSMKLRGEWMIYTARPKWRSRVSHYFIPDAKAEERFKAAGVAKDRYSTVGNLVLDSVPECGSVADARRKVGLADGEEAVSLLPGSRPFEYQEGAAFFCRAAQEILSKFAGYGAFIPLAPTVEERRLKEGFEKAGIEWKGGDRAEEISWNGAGRIRLLRENTFEAIRASRLAVALPGTNNLQIASLGTPLLMVAPLNEAENIPLDGLPGIIPTSLPGAKRLKKKLVYWYNERERFISLPNRLAQKQIVPEYRRAMTPSTVASLACDLLGSPEKLDEIRKNYAELRLERGAAAKIADKIKGYFS